MDWQFVISIGYSKSCKLGQSLLVFPLFGSVLSLKILRGHISPGFANIGLWYEVLNVDFIEGVPLEFPRWIH